MMPRAYSEKRPPLGRGDELMPSVHLSASPAPAPAMASKIQHQKQPQRFLTLEFQDAVA
jgi:hypothetical protein